MTTVGLRGIEVVHAGRRVLRDVHLDVASGEVVALLGASGSGKTSLLRVVAGFVQPSAGRVLVGGRDVTHLPTRDRDLGMVAQGAPLQPTRDVGGNLTLPLDLLGEDDRAQRRRRAEVEARAFGLWGLLRRRPRQLSTGQRAAAATARAVVRPRSALLLDEPAVHLDPVTRAEVLAQVRTVQRGHGTTMLLATNELGVAHALADRVGVLAHGTLAAVGTLAELRAAPGSLDVADLVGGAPLARLPGRVLPGSGGGRARVRTAAGDVPTWSPALRDHRGPVLLGVGPHDVTLGDPGPDRLAGTVRHVGTTGPERVVTVATHAGPVTVNVRDTAPSHGEAVGLLVHHALVATDHGTVLAVVDRPSAH